MTQHSRYPDGAPCWADLNTPDLAGAQRFYGALLGWTFDEGAPEMGYYAICRRDGQSVAGIAPKMPGMDIPSMWSVYLKSSDLDASARQIEAGDAELLNLEGKIPPGKNLSPRRPEPVSRPASLARYSAARGGPPIARRGACL